MLFDYRMYLNEGTKWLPSKGIHGTHQALEIFKKLPDTTLVLVRHAQGNKRLIVLYATKVGNEIKIHHRNGP